MNRKQSADALLAEFIHKNVARVRTLHERNDLNLSRHLRAIERGLGFLRQPTFLYMLVCLSVFWIGINVFAHRLGLSVIDEPPFFWLQGLQNFVALVVSIMVLTGQTRQERIAEERAHLSLQVSLLSEQKIAKLIELVIELRRDLPSVKDSDDPVADAMRETANPEMVLEALSKNVNRELHTIERIEDEVMNPGGAATGGSTPG